MSSVRHSLATHLPQMGLAAQCALLAAATTCLFLVAGGVGSAFIGVVAWEAAAVAALLCLLGSELALLSTRLTRRNSPADALRGMLVAMAFRLAVPTAGAVLISVASPRLVQADALIYLIVFYLLTLALEVGLEVSNISTTDFRVSRG